MKKTGNKHFVLIYRLRWKIGTLNRKMIDVNYKQMIKEGIYGENMLMGRSMVAWTACTLDGTN